MDRAVARNPEMWVSGTDNFRGGGCRVEGRDVIVIGSSNFVFVTHGGSTKLGEKEQFNSIKIFLQCQRTNKNR